MKNETKAFAANTVMGVTNTTGIVMGFKAGDMAGMLSTPPTLHNMVYLAGLVFCAYKAGDSLGKGLLHPVRDFNRVSDDHPNCGNAGRMVGGLTAFAIMMQGFAALQPAPPRQEAAALVNTAVPSSYGPAKAPALQPGK